MSLTGDKGIVISQLEALKEGRRIHPSTFRHSGNLSWITLENIWIKNQNKSIVMSISPKHFDLILVDVQEELCDHWKISFEPFKNVSVYQGSFQEVKEYDCLVSPANSFGLMDGGIDLAIRNYFGMQLQYEVQKIIQKKFYGEQPVGTSVIVHTFHDDFPFLAHTPTMRVPLDISKTDNVYNAMFAMLRTIADFNKNNNLRINKVLCPGLGTGTGRVPLKEASRQMMMAYKNFMNPTTNMVWKNLIERNRDILGQSDN